MFLLKRISLLLALLLILAQCRSVSEKTAPNESDWKTRLNELLPLLGHRNWIIVVDKAFPLQSAANMAVINTNENMVPVLQYVFGRIDSSTHVKPLIYRDKELTFVTEQDTKGVTSLVQQTSQVFANRPVRPILHDSVFTKLSEASRLFKVVVLKTDEIIPYSSVFLELDCAYWNAEKEQRLRRAIRP